MCNGNIVARMGGILPSTMGKQMATARRRNQHILLVLVAGTPTREHRRKMGRVMDDSGGAACTCGRSSTRLFAGRVVDRADRSHHMVSSYTCCAPDRSANGPEITDTGSSAGSMGHRLLIVFQLEELIRCAVQNVTQRGKEIDIDALRGASDDFIDHLLRDIDTACSQRLDKICGFEHTGGGHDLT